MPGIIEGYNYDIFISYRQKDNKYDGWVTEFVDNLKNELESTFKEEIRIYYDTNPHDGLLETHDVDESLKEKLKCLIFIPIISRTYCDPKSFAWEHEFKAFVEQASKDQFGLKVKLPNGNVASRVLPVRIHDLDNADIKLCESVLGGVLRCVEFVYKESGVNRPLRSIEDSPDKNLNKTFYRNQINKVALAIKENIIGLMAVESCKTKEEKPYQRKTIDDIIDEKIRYKNLKLFKSTKRKAVYGILTIAILIITLIILYPEYLTSDTFKKHQLSGERISVAVMPFQNMTNDSLWNIWQDAIQDNLITSLSNSEDLMVRNKESVNRLLMKEAPVNYASAIPSLARIISQKLDADVFISGSINQAGTLTRLNAQLINSKTDEVFKSFQIAGSSEEMLYTVDSLSRAVMDFLIISKLVKQLPPYLRYKPLTTSPEAYRCYLQGESARSRKDYSTARKMYTQALSLDSNYTHMTLMLSITCLNDGLFEEARKWSDKAYEKIDLMPTRQKILLNKNHAHFYETPHEEIKYLRQLLEIDDKSPDTYYDIGLSYSTLLQYDKAIPEFLKALKIYDKLDMKPWWIYNYTELGNAYHYTGQYKKEKKLYKKAEMDFPDESTLTWRQAILFLTLGDTSMANKYIDKYKSIYKDNSWSEAALARNMGWAYSQAGMQDRAEESFRKAVNLEPENGFWYYYLSWHLIDKNRDIIEGLELIDKALELNPNYEWVFLSCKGWGLFKQGKYQESLELLEKAWDLKPTYNHELYLHLEAAKKSVANLSNN